MSPRPDQAKAKAPKTAAAAMPSKAARICTPVRTAHPHNHDLDTGLKIARAMTEPIDQSAYRRNVTAGMVSAGAHFPVWQMPQRESEQGVTISYAQDGLGQSQIKDRFDD